MITTKLLVRILFALEIADVARRVVNYAVEKKAKEMELEERVRAMEDKE